MTGGRPLRFLAVALGGWVAIRIALLLPDAGLPAIARTFVPPTAAATLRAPRVVAVSPGLPTSVAIIAAVPVRPTLPRPVRQAEAVAILAAQAQRATGMPVAGTAMVAPPPPQPSPFAPPVVARSRSAFAGSVWLLARGGAGGTVSGGQLGASQAGVRITYALTESRRLSLAARLATPLRGRGREAALGVEWQPTNLPVRLVAEQRVSLEGGRGGRGGPTVGLIGGFGPTAIGHGFRIEGYGQAGGIARDGLEGFVDASARLTRPVVRVAGARVELGVGAWGSAQRDARRFDIGPSIAVALPVADRAIRVTLDWRERLGGNARPGSGPALSIGSDF